MPLNDVRNGLCVTPEGADAFCNLSSDDLHLYFRDWREEAFVFIRAFIFNYPEQAVKRFPDVAEVTSGIDFNIPRRIFGLIHCFDDAARVAILSNDKVVNALTRFKTYSEKDIQETIKEARASIKSQPKTKRLGGSREKSAGLAQSKKHHSFKKPTLARFSGWELNF